MRICGVAISGSCANLVVIEKSKGTLLTIRGIPKICIKDDRSQEEVKTFLATLTAFTQDTGVEVMFIKSRSKRGEYAGGPVGFKLEGLVQLLPIPAVFVSPVRIASATKTISKELLDSVFGYQVDALRVAYTGMEQNAKDRPKQV